MFTYVGRKRQCPHSQGHPRGCLLQTQDPGSQGTAGGRCLTVGLKAGDPAGPHPLNRETCPQGGKLPAGDLGHYTALWPPNSALWDSGTGLQPLCGISTSWGGQKLSSGCPQVPGSAGLWSPVRLGPQPPSGPLQGAQGVGHVPPSPSSSFSSFLFPASPLLHLVRDPVSLHLLGDPGGLGVVRELPNPTTFLRLLGSRSLQ